jgi:hypothetical protein
MEDHRDQADTASAPNRGGAAVSASHHQVAKADRRSLVLALTQLLIIDFNFHEIQTS